MSDKVPLMAAAPPGAPMMVAAAPGVPMSAEQPPAYAQSLPGYPAGGHYQNQHQYVDPYGRYYGSTAVVTHTVVNTNQGMYATVSRAFDHWSAQRKLVVIFAFLITMASLSYAIHWGLQVLVDDDDDDVFCDLKRSETACIDLAQCVWDGVTETCSRG